MEFSSVFHPLVDEDDIWLADADDEDDEDDEDDDDCIILADDEEDCILTDPDDSIILAHPDDDDIDDSSAMRLIWHVAMGDGDRLSRRFRPSAMMVMALSTSNGFEHR